MELLVHAFVIIYLKIAFAAADDQTDLIVDHIMEQLPHHITVFTHDLKDKIENKNALIEKIATKIPVIVINTKKMEPQNGLEAFETSIFIDPIAVTVYVILVSDKDIENDFDLQNLVDNFIFHLSPRPIRPKCLIIYFNKNFTFGNWLLSLLKYSWTKKFLDFTLLNFSEPNKVATVIISYDPFRRSFNFQPLTINSELFPDKLTDTNGYLFRVPFINVDPYIICKKSNVKNKCTGLAYSIIDIVTSAMKMKIHVKDQVHQRIDKQLT